MRPFILRALVKAAEIVIVSVAAAAAALLLARPWIRPDPF